MSKTIPLTKGYVAIVDDEDYDWLSRLKWNVKVDVHTVYAMRQIRIAGEKKSIYMHRIITGAMPGEKVDHKNHNGLDNQRANLRTCTNSQNNGNQRVKQGGSSQCKGVCWQKSAGKWRTLIRHNNSDRHLGLFTDEIEAAEAYDRAARTQWGEFAKTNFNLKGEQ